MYAVGGCYVSEYGVFSYEVADHDKSPSSPVECSEQCFFHPVGESCDACGAFAQFVVVEVVDDDIVGSVGAVAQSAW